MTIALITTGPRVIVDVQPGPLMNVNIRGKFQAYNVGVGWASPDGSFQIVPVTNFVVPNGQVPIGTPTYTFDGNGNVIETFATQAAPLSNIQFAQFIGRWTTAEYALLMQKRAAAITAGTAGAMALVIQWDQALAMGSVDLNTAAAQNFKAALVTAAILTQARADAIFA